MKISFNLFDRSTKRKIYLSIGFLFIVFSASIIASSIIQNRKLKNILIESSLNEYQAEITHGLNIIQTNQAQMLRILSSNSLLKDAIVSKDTAYINEHLEPLFYSILSSSGSFIQVYDTTGGILYSKGVSDKSSIIELSRADQKKQFTIEQSFLLSQEGLFLVSSMPLSKEQNASRIRVGIKDSHSFSFLESKPDGILFTVFNKEFIPEFTNHGSFDWDNLLVRSYTHPEAVKTFANKGYLTNGAKRTIKAGGNSYILLTVGEFTTQEGQNAGRMLFALNVTQFQRVYTSHLFRISLITLVSFLLAFILIRLLLSRLVKSWLKIESVLEKKITQRTQEIIDTNAEFSQLFNSTANGIRIINQNYEITRVNDAFSRISGISREKIEGRFCYNVFSSVFCHTSNCPLKRLKEGDSNIDMEEVRFKRDGQKVVCQHTAMPFIGNNGEFLGIIEDFKDITEKQAAEQKLRRTQAQFTSFMDFIPVAVLIKDSDGSIQYQNTYFKSYLGDTYLAQQKQSNNDRDADGPLSPSDLQVLKEGKVEMEESITDSTGTERTFMTHKFRFYGLENKWLIGSISIDITTRKLAEHQFYVLTKAIRNSPVGAAITSPEGNIEFVNPAYELIVGKFEADLIGQPIENLYGEETPLKTPKEAALNGDTWQGEVNLSGIDKKPIWISLSVAPVYNRKDEIAHLIFLMEDITSRKEYERELLLSKNRAEESDQLKTAFLGNLSHEIRTPLNAIIGFSSLLNEKEVTEEEKRIIPDMLFKHSNALLSIIDNIIDVAAIETNQFSVSKTECSLNHLIDEVYSELISTDKKSNNVRIHLKREVQEESFTILTDQSRLRQVFRHLLSNALKFTESGFIELGYTFRDADTLMFYVMDTGIGMEQDEVDRIFRSFSMGDDTNTRKFHGLGLGLSISKHIVEKLGGKMWVNTTMGQGSTFFFTMPYTPLYSKFEKEEPLADKLSGYNWRDRTILVADDADSNFKFLQALIKPTKANVIWAKNGQEAVYLTKSSKVDLILMDIVMPEMDGFEATRKIKIINKDVPVICQTAYPSPENIRASRECGMDTWLAKPIALHNMLKTIDQFFKKN